MMDKDNYAQTILSEESKMTLTDISYHYEYLTIYGVGTNCYRTNACPHLESAG